MAKKILGMIQDKVEFVENNDGILVERTWYYLDKKVDNVSDINAEIQALQAKKTQVEQLIASKQAAK